MSVAAPLVSTLPWVLLPMIGVMRASRSRSLDDESATAPVPTPHVSVIIPARNERRNIERCLRSVLLSTYPALDVVVVDDDSDDGTGDVARAVATTDHRVRVIEASPLAPGWFGKQWACAAGSAVASGAILLFTDADTTHGTELIARAVNAMRRRGADLLSIAGSQEMHGFWERVIQPQMFGMLSLRYGGTEAVSNARRAEDVIANGQCIFVRRDAYESVGGHASVRDKVAEDLALAQLFYRSGMRVTLIAGVNQLSTRMYSSLAELVHGWQKNVYAGGRDAVVGGRIGRLLFPVLLVAAPLVALAPVAAVPIALVGWLSTSWLVWGVISVLATVCWWSLIYGALQQPRWYALLSPLGAAAFLYIVIGALAHGSRVGWKGRKYIAR